MLNRTDALKKNKHALLSLLLNIFSKYESLKRKVPQVINFLFLFFRCLKF